MLAITIDHVCSRLAEAGAPREVVQKARLDLRPTDLALALPYVLTTPNGTMFLDSRPPRPISPCSYLADLA